MRQEKKQGYNNTFASQTVHEKKRKKSCCHTYFKLIKEGIEILSQILPKAEEREVMATGAF